MRQPQKSGFVFEDLVLRFTRQTYYEDEHAYQLQVRETPTPIPGGAFQVDTEADVHEFQSFFRNSLANRQFLASLQAPDMLSSPDEELQQLGGKLRSMLPQAFQQELPRLLQNVFEKGHGLLLILEASAGEKADRLLSLPWELLYFAETETFLARSPRVLIVRRVLNATRRAALPIKPPFKVLHVIAHSDSAPDQYHIDAGLRQIERDTLARTLGASDYHCVDNPGSIEQMQNALAAHASHVVHFLGHGEIATAADNQRGYLRFVGPGDQAQPVSGDHFEHLLNFAPSVQIVVLNACHGGANLTRSVALELVHHGLPYVVALQSDILQESAKHFIAAFYSALQRGTAIERAVAEGRAAIATHVPQVMDWCLPVLYTNAGLAAPTPEDQNAAQLWGLASHPQAKRWFGISNAFFGGLHLITALLLFISAQSPALPSANYTPWLTAALAALPALITFIVHRRQLPTIPKTWPTTTRWAYLARVLGAASIGFALPMMIYPIAILNLMAGFGFWELLTPLASGLLLGLILVPSLWFSYHVSRSQIYGHAKSFANDAQIDLPTFRWGDLILTFAGYLMLAFPWLALTFWRDLLAPPLGNALTGIILLALGISSWKEYRDENR